MTVRLPGKGLPGRYTISQASVMRAINGVEPEIGNGKVTGDKNKYEPINKTDAVSYTS
jgi:hypothetical protein